MAAGDTQTKLGALKVLDRSLWLATMRLAFEDGRTVMQAIAWMKERGYGEPKLRTMAHAKAEAERELGHSLTTERPPEPPSRAKSPCKECRGFGRKDESGRPSLKKSHAACAVCGGTGKVQGEVRA